MSMLSKDQQLLQHVLQYCEKINATVNRFGKDYNTFIADQDYIDSISMNLLQIGELAGKFSNEYVLLTKPQIDWRAIKNMRNMFAHDYNSMDIDRIWETTIEDIPILEAFCSEQLTETDQEDEEVPTQSM